MKGLTPEEMQKLLLSVGTHRRKRPLSPVEVGRLVAKALAAGTTRQEAAAALHVRDTGLLGEFVTLTRLDPSLQAVVGWGKSPTTIAFSVASELGRLRGAEQTEATKLALGYFLSRDEVKHVVQRRLRSGRALQECAEEIVNLRPSVVRRHVLIGAIASEALRIRLEGMSQEDRDHFLLRGLRRLVSGDASSGLLAVRLGPSRFVLVGDDELASSLAATGDFEASMNSSLEELVERG